MPAQIEPDFTLNRAARATEDARLAAGSASRLNLPAPHRRLVGKALRHLDVAQDSLFAAYSMPIDAPAPKPKQLSLETL